MDRFEIENEIFGKLNSESMEYWAGMDQQGRNEAVDIARAEGIDAAVMMVEDLAKPDED